MTDSVKDTKDAEPKQHGRPPTEAPVEVPQELLAQTEEFLRSPDLIEQTIEHIHTLGVAGEDELALAVYLIGTSRLLPRPLAGLVTGASSAGKSFVISTVAKLFPRGATIQAHRDVSPIDGDLVRLPCFALEVPLRFLPKDQTACREGIIGSGDIQFVTIRRRILRGGRGV